MSLSLTILNWSNKLKKTILLATFSTLAIISNGCVPGEDFSFNTPGSKNLLSNYLPRSLKIHANTKMGDINNGKFGIDAFIQTLDPWGDTTKAYGNFRIELYTFQEFHHERKGAPVEMWDIRLGKPKNNQKYWDHHSKSYHFSLGMVNKVSAGRRMILKIYYNDEYTKRLTVENMIISG